MNTLRNAISCQTVNPSNSLSHDTHDYNDTNSHTSQVPMSHNMIKTSPKTPNEVTSYTVSNTHPNTQQALHIHHSTTNSSQREPTNHHNVTDTSQLEPMDHRQMKTLPKLQHPVMYNQGTITKLCSTTNASMVEVNSETKSHRNNTGHYGTTTNLSISHSSLSIHKIFSSTADKCQLLASKVLNRI